MPSSSRGGRIIQIGKTFGIEFETAQINPNIPFRDDAVLSIFRPGNDASIQTDRYMLNNGLIVEKTDNRILNYVSKSNITTGTEFVSIVLDDENILEILKRFTEFLGENGEDGISERTGIHFHVSLPNPNLGMLKAILNLGLNLESLFFALGGMGYRFRGEQNDSIYCRPISKKGPSCVDYYHGGHVQCYEIDTLLNTANQEDFWTNYGDLRNYSQRYQPVRYSWLNLYPMCPWGEYKGTLEFRVFNTTLNPYYIYGVLQLCKAFTEFSVSNFRNLKFSEYLGQNSVYDLKDLNQVLSLLDGASKVLELDNKVIYILESILNSTPLPKLKDEYVFSHLLFSRRGSMPRFFQGINLTSITEKIKKPEYVDIHVLRGETR